jgi:hypothetical protein
MVNMNILLFGATGMIGQGVLRECLLDPDVRRVQTVGRTATGVPHPKLREVVHTDLLYYASTEDQLSGFDACFFCLGVSSAGMAEADYERVTYRVTLAAAETLSRLNPGMTFIYVSGAGTDSSEHGRAMWARVKGKTENGSLAVQGRLYVPPRRNPAAARRAIEDGGVPRPLFTHQAPFANPSPGRAGPDRHNRTDGPRHAHRCQAGRPEADSRKLRHQRHRASGNRSLSGKSLGKSRIRRQAGCVGTRQMPRHRFLDHGREEGYRGVKGDP